RLQIFGFDPDIPPANLFTCVFFISDGMNLQADQAAWGEVVLQMGCRHAVQPGPDGAADALDAGLVPLSLFEGLLGFGIQGEWIKSSSSPFIIDSRAPGPLGWVQCILIPVHTALHSRGIMNASELDARIDGWLHHEFEFQNKIPVFAVGGQEAVWTACNRGSNDLSVFHPVFRGAVHLFPSAEIGSVEKVDPALVGLASGGRSA